MADLKGMKAGDTAEVTFYCAGSWHREDVTISKMGREYAYVDNGVIVQKFRIADGIEVCDRAGADVLSPKSSWGPRAVTPTRSLPSPISRTAPGPRPRATAAPPGGSHI
ncbi:hypothetical protein [Streptomyces agglomeratus]|uniref:hypothetical protein n=1 Tax=Streptomyces agglomeratus TaxID=285458 RepID=UPI00159F2905|nr:hypothetical protein [Streptomyces agglomeratus]